MAFDDILEPKRRTPLSEGKSSPPNAKKTQSILDNFDVNEWSKRLGLNDELTQQVIVPLLGILDKHGGKVVSPQGKGAQAVSAVSSIMEDFGPLLQGAYRYFAGVRHELNKADEDLLNAHSAALSATELTSLFGSDDELVIEDETNQTQQPQQQQQQQGNPFGPDDFNPPSASHSIVNQGKVDYYALMGYGSEESHQEGEANKVRPSSVYSDQTQNRDNQIVGKNSSAPQKQVGLVPVDFLALEGGLSQFELKQSDTTARINEGASIQTVDVSTDEGLAMANDGLDLIQEAMFKEKMKRRTSSKNPAEQPSMTNDEIIAHMKQSAKPGRGGQSIGDKDVGKAKSSITDAELASFVGGAFDISGLAELQAQEAAERKASSKMGDTAELLKVEEEQKKGGNAYNQTPMSADVLEVLGDNTQVETTTIDDSSPQPISIHDLVGANIGIVGNIAPAKDD